MQKLSCWRLVLFAWEWKDHFHIDGFTLSLALIQRPGAIQKWPSKWRSFLCAETKLIYFEFFSFKLRAVLHCIKLSVVWTASGGEDLFTLYPHLPPSPWGPLRRVPQFPCDSLPVSRMQEYHYVIRREFLGGQHSLTSVERPLDTLWSLHKVD